MWSTLLDADEETDPSVYGAYLRAQSDADLLDIMLHLDPNRYPARCDAAGRELNRRRLWQAHFYTPSESLIRYTALVAFAVSVFLLALMVLMTPKDAAGPSWPTGEMLSDGMPMNEFVRLFAVALLRGIIVWSAHLGVFSLLSLFLAGWVGAQTRPLWHRRARADVWRLALLGLSSLLVALTLASGPRSAVPMLFQTPDHATAWERALPLWEPFASYPSAS